MNFKNWFEENREHAAAVALVHQGRVLILQRGPTAPWMPNKWNLPGGVVDEGESPIQAAARECQEEAGIFPKNIRMLRKFNASTYDVDFFVGECDTDRVKIDYESQNYKWIAPQEVNNYQYVPFVKEAVMLALGINTEQLFVSNYVDVKPEDMRIVMGKFVPNTHKVYNTLTRKIET